MNQFLRTILVFSAVTFLIASCNNDCDCTKIVEYYDASGTRVDSEIYDIRDDCGKQENYTEQDGEGTKEITIICEPW